MNSTNPYVSELSYTYVNSKIMCIREMFYFHVVCAYLISITGIGAMVTRLWAGGRPYHHIFGRLYLIVMFLAMGSALVITNHGMPVPILFSFLWLLAGLTVGILTIGFHRMKFEKQVHDAAGAKLIEMAAKSPMSKLDLDMLIKQTRGQVAGKKSFTERLFSYKTAHGISMGVSLWQMVGRIFFSDQVQNFECITYPAYKLASNPHHTYRPGDVAEFLPAENPDGSPLTRSVGVIAAFSVGNLLGPLLIGIAIAVWVAYREDNRRKTKPKEAEATEALVRPPSPFT